MMLLASGPLPLADGHPRDTPAYWPSCILINCISIIRTVGCLESNGRTGLAQTFGKFELDEARRELRLKGEVIPLQPKVFDLLALLFHNRDRVMSKDELLDTLWPGVIVGDGSLQRAVSLARSALKQGGLGNAIRNYTRQGYRLCIDALTREHAEPSPGGDLEQARQAYLRGDWELALEAYRSADAGRALEAADLERLDNACQCAGRPTDSEPYLERAAAAFAAKGDRRGSARVALRLAELAFESGRMSVAQGWLARGRRYLNGIDECFEHGLEAYVSARLSVAGGQPHAAREHARRGLKIGQRLANDDIEALGRAYLGFAELSLGHVDVGMPLMDEAGAAVLAGSVSPWVGGIIYCGLIWACCNRGDWGRATQWADSFTNWCERSGMKRFSGLCQLHQAEVVSISGPAEEAEKQIRKACTQLAQYSPFAEGDAFRVLGDHQLLRGDLDAAETSYRRAHDLGWDPQPGLAMLQAERGDAQSAILGLERSLADSNWAVQQRRGLLLAQLVIIAARAGDRARAKRAMDELESSPGLWASDYHGAAVARARAELAALEGNLGGAVTIMRETIRSWRAARATLNLANCRFRLAEWLAQQGDVPGAILEVDAAYSCFEAMGAPERLRACERFREALQDAPAVSR